VERTIIQIKKKKGKEHQRVRLKTKPYVINHLRVYLEIYEYIS
jgi:hypothetical protein